MPHPAYAPAPGLDVPEEPRLAGEWTTPTIDGPKPLDTSDGYHYGIPDTAVVQFVSAARGLQIAHVRVGKRVYVLARGLQLVESEEDSFKRGAPSAWADLRHY